MTACTLPSSIALAYGGMATQVSSFRSLHGAHYPLDAVRWRRPEVDRMEYVLPAIVAVVVGPLSAWITVKLSLRRFRAEKWWEMRVEAYRRVIEALHDATKYPEAHFDAAVEGYKISDKGKEELRFIARKASIEILRATETGALLLSSRALCRLRKYQEERMEVGHSGVDIASQYDLHLGAINTCLNDLIDIARRDLKIDG